MTTKLTMILTVFLLMSASVNATIITFTDRAAFESALTSFIIDDLDDVLDGQYPLGLDRGDYSFTMSSYGCNSGPGQCGDNSSDGFVYPAYIWTYDSGFFNFNNLIYAFGLDYGHYPDSTATITLNGLTATTDSGGFFGFISSTAFSSVSYLSTSSGALFDNVTYSSTQSTPSQVSLPATLSLLATGLVGLLFRRKQKTLKA